MRITARIRRQLRKSERSVGVDRVVAEEHARHAAKEERRRAHEERLRIHAERRAQADAERRMPGVMPGVKISTRCDRMLAFVVSVVLGREVRDEQL